MVALAYPLARRYPVGRGYGDTSISWAGVHTGIDIGAPFGTPILAPAPGIGRTYWNLGGGRMVAVDHGNGLETRYAHLAVAMVRNDQRVAAGQQIGTVGASGRVTGAHLHYEILVGGKTIDPAPYLGGATVPTAQLANAKPRVCVSR